MDWIRVAQVWGPVANNVMNFLPHTLRVICRQADRGCSLRDGNSVARTEIPFILAAVLWTADKTKARICFGI